jgi:phosphoribosylformylglycinamidine cyclo-ligase
VSSDKPDVHAAIEKLDKGLYPGAFCKIMPDVLTGDPNFCLVQHSDGAGTKASLAYLVGKLEKTLKVWKGTLLDSMIMNLDDLGCVGCFGPFLVSLIIDRNLFLIPGEVVKAIIEACQEVCEQLTALGIPCYLSGGETADVGDLVRTITVNNTITARILREHVIDAGQISAPAFIVGFSSTGQAAWETEPNSGIGSNGLTNARHDALSPWHRQFIETFCPQTPWNETYSGKYALNDKLPGDPRFTIGSALLSPTRTYIPLMKRIFDDMQVGHIMGFIHCSGGGQTKIGKFGKFNMFPTPPLFQMLQDVRGLPPREMYSSYNMGHRLEAVVRTQSDADRCITIAKDCNIDAQVVGEVLPFDDPNSRQVEIVTEEGSLFYPPVQT